MFYLLPVLTINVLFSYSWQSIPSPDIKTYAHTVIYDPANDLFFIMGGDSTGYTTNMDICLQFDPKTNTWETKTPMFKSKRDHSATYRKGFIHILCGVDNYYNRISDHEVYNISNNSWDLLAPAPIPVSTPGLGTWRDSLIYIMGGYDSYSETRTEVYYYNPSTNSWDSATSLPRPFHGGGVKIEGDSIYIVGGGDGSTGYSKILLGEINPDNPAEINWYWGNSLPISSNYYNGFTIKENESYMIGGAFNNGTNEVWKYDLSDGTWTSLPDYPTNIIMRGKFAERRDGADSMGVIYCFMGDTSQYSSRKPTDECYRLLVSENDAGMYVINSPVSDTTIDAFVQVNGTVKNYGNNTYSFKTYVNIYDPDLIIAFSDSIEVEDLSASDTLNVDFGSFELTKAGTYTVEMFTYAFDDMYSQNDSLTATFSSFDCFWESIPSADIKTLAHGVIYDPINDLFFITGGDSTNFEDSGYMDICLEFDPKTNSWDTKQPMPTGRGRHRAVYRNGHMHVFCGKDVYGNHLTSHEVYNINSDSWETAKSAPLLVSRPSVVTWRDSLIYLMGGYDPTHTARNEVYVYYPETNSWDSATFLPRRLHAGTAEIKGDSIFIIGGADGSTYYSNILIGEINPDDPTEINWSWGNSLPMAFNVANGLAIKDNKAYMIGGSFNDGTNETWQYDIQNGNWTSLPDYPARFIHRGDFAQRRNGPDSMGIVYCFMGDTSDYWSRTPTNECYRLTIAPFSGINEEEQSKKNSIYLSNTIFAGNDITVNCMITGKCDLKINLYDVVGRAVFSKIEKNISTGQHQFDIKGNLKNGIYFIKIEAGSTVKDAKLILIR